LPTNSNTGVAIIIKIKSVEYQNEASSDPPDKENAEKSDNKTFLLSTYATHQITLDDITFYTEEFRIDEDRSESQEKELSQTESEQESRGINSQAQEENEEMYEDTRDDKDGEETNVYRNKRVMFGRMPNRQEIRLNMKLSEYIEGPKVELQMSIGALTLYLSPRQLHLLLLLSDILINGEQSTGVSGDVEQEDRQQEIELERNASRKPYNLNAGGILANQAWSSADPNDEFRYSTDFTSADLHCINRLHPIGSESIFSSNSSMSSSIGSSASQGTSKRKRAIEKDINADISRFNIRLAGVYLILLHDDVLMESTAAVGPPLSTTSVDKLNFRTERFFDFVVSEIMSCSTSDLGKIGSVLYNACDNSNHLR
jgi:autophagy-related protein 2